MDNKNKIFNDRIEEAINSKDFSKLNSILNDTLSAAFKAAQTGVGKMNDYLNSRNSSQSLIPVRNPDLVVQKIPMESLAGVFKVLGTASLWIHGGLGIMFLIAAVFSNSSYMYDLLSNWIVPALIISYIFVRKGGKMHEKSVRFRKYMRAFGKSSICSLKDLSGAVNLDSESVIKDFEYFIKKDYLKEARFIENKSYLVLDNNTYREYKKTLFDKDKRIKETAESASSCREETVKEDKTSSEYAEYTEYMEKYSHELRNIERNTEGAMRGKVSKLISVVDRIFSFSEKNPETSASSYKFMEYYLPTTVKILDSYIEFSRIEIKGENIVSAMNDIENSMDTILIAFSNFLDHLYQDSTMDIQTDISVLKTVMSQDGLLDKDFNTGK